MVNNRTHICVIDNGVFCRQIGFGIVETYGSDTVLVDGKMHQTRASNSIATPYVTSKIADIYFKGITPFYIRRFFSQEQIDINCFYVDWIEQHILAMCSYHLEYAVFVFQMI